MRGIIGVEEPAHTLPFAALSVILAQRYGGKSYAHLKQTETKIDEYAVNGGVGGDIYKQLYHLALEVSAVIVKGDYNEHRYAAPVGGKSYHCDNESQDDLQMGR